MLSAWQMWAVLGTMLEVGARVGVGVGLREFARAAFLVVPLAAFFRTGLDLQVSLFLGSTLLLFLAKRGGMRLKTNIRGRDLEDFPGKTPKQTRW